MATSLPFSTGPTTKTASPTETGLAPSIDIALVTKQIRWALLDPAHDKRVTERLLASVEDNYRLTQEAAKAIARHSMKIEAELEHRKAALETWGKAYSDIETKWQKTYADWLKDQDHKWWFTEEHPRMVASW